MKRRRFRILFGSYDLWGNFIHNKTTITLLELKFHGWEYFGYRLQNEKKIG